MKRILLILVVLVLLAGCAQQGVEPTRTTQTGETPTEPGETPTEPQQPEEPTKPLVIDPALKNKIEEVLKGGKYIYVTEGYAKLKVGEGHVFGLGIANYQYMTGATYAVEVSFIEARDSNNNIIDTDQGTMASWLEKYTTKKFTLDADMYTVVSIPIVVKGLIRPNRETMPGSYYFDARVFRYKGNFREQEGATQRYTVRVIK